MRRIAAFLSRTSMLFGLVVLLAGCTSSGGETTSSPTVTVTNTTVPTTTATALPTASPSAEASGSPTLTATATPTSTPSDVASPTATASVADAPTTGSPWSAANFLASLDDAGIDVAPTGRTFACSSVGGLAGAEYGGDADFILWVYPSPEAAAAEWVLDPYGGRHPVLECNHPPSRIFARDNLVVATSAAPGFSQETAEAGRWLLLLGRGGVPLPSDINQFALLRPAEGDPLGAAPLLNALLAQGLNYAPYEQPACPYGESAAVLQWMALLPDGESSHADFQLWVFPSVAALEAEWELGVDGAIGSPGVHRSRFCENEYSGGEIYRNANQLLMTGGSAATGAGDRERVISAFLALTP